MKRIIFVTLISYILTSSITTPEEIIDWIKENKTLYDKDNISCYILTNSTDYIDLNQYDLLYNVMKEAKKNTNFDYVLAVVDHIDMSVNEPARKFAEDLQALMGRELFIEHQKSVVMVFAIVDRKFNIEAGYDASLKFSGDRLAKYLDLIKTNLQNKDYHTAFSKLLGYFRDNYYPPSTPSSDNNGSSTDVLSIVVIVVVVVLVIIIRLVCKYYCGCKDSYSYSYSSHSGYRSHHSHHNYHHHSSSRGKSGGGAKSHGSGASGGW